MRIMPCAAAALSLLVLTGCGTQRQARVKNSTAAGAATGAGAGFGAFGGPVGAVVGGVIGGGGGAVTGATTTPIRSTSDAAPSTTRTPASPATTHRRHACAA